MTETRKTQTAQALGISEDRIHSVRAQLSILRTQGILIDLDVRGVGMFTKTASWAEIGIQADENDPRFNRLMRGQKYLIDEKDVKQLKSVESRMRQLVDRYCRDVTGFRPYRWLPFTAYRTFKDEWNDLLREFDTLKQYLLDKHPRYIDEVEEGYRELAAASWRSITSHGYQWAIVDGKACDRQAFITTIVRKAVEQIPSKYRIENELIADYRVALVYGEEDIALDEVQAQQVRLDFENRREQQRHLTMMNQLEEDARSQRIQSMIAEEAAHAREQLQQIASPFEEVFTSLRRQIAEDARTILDSIRRNGFVRGKVAQKGAGLVELFDLLATHNDRELRDRLQRLKDAIGPIGDDRSDGDTPRDTTQIVSILEEIGHLESQAVADLLSGPSRFSMVEA